jgi:hypothetical protein
LNIVIILSITANGPRLRQLAGGLEAIVEGLEHRIPMLALTGAM